MYAMVATWSELAFAVNVVNQFLLKLGPMHWMAIKRVMWYLESTLEMRLRIGGQHINIKSYSNVD